MPKAEAKRFAYPKVLLDRCHEVAYSPLTGLWYVAIIGSDATFTASATTLKEAAVLAIKKVSE